jgi:hypothetical protein
MMELRPGRVLTVFVFLALIAAAFAPVGCTLSDTPRRSLAELRSALLDHDADRALRYVDVDSIVECVARDILLKYEARSEDPLEQAGVRIGREVSRLLMPGAKAIARKRIREAIASVDQWGYFDDIRRSSVWYLAVDVDGDAATVAPKGKADVMFRMARAPEGGYWRITEIVLKHHRGGKG